MQGCFTPLCSVDVPTPFRALCRWRAANYSQFWGMTLEDGMRYRLGTFRPPPTVMNMNEMHVSGTPQILSCNPRPQSCELPRFLETAAQHIPPRNPCVASVVFAPSLLAGFPSESRPHSC